MKGSLNNNEVHSWFLYLDFIKVAQQGHLPPFKDVAGHNNQTAVWTRGGGESMFILLVQLHAPHRESKDNKRKRRWKIWIHRAAMENDKI